MFWIGGGGCRPGCGGGGGGGAAGAVLPEAGHARRVARPRARRRHGERPRRKPRLRDAAPVRLRRAALPAPALRGRGDARGVGGRTRDHAEAPRRHLVRPGGLLRHARPPTPRHGGGPGLLPQAHRRREGLLVRLLAPRREGRGHRRVPRGVDERRPDRLLARRPRPARARRAHGPHPPRAPRPAVPLGARDALRGARPARGGRGVGASLRNARGRVRPLHARVVAARPPDALRAPSRARHGARPHAAARARRARRHALRLGRIPRHGGRLHALALVPARRVRRRLRHLPRQLGRRDRPRRRPRARPRRARRAARLGARARELLPRLQHGRPRPRPEQEAPPGDQLRVRLGAVVRAQPRPPPPEHRAAPARRRRPPRDAPPLRLRPRAREGAARRGRLPGRHRPRHGAPPRAAPLARQVRPGDARGRRAARQLPRPDRHRALARLLDLPAVHADAQQARGADVPHRMGGGLARCAQLPPALRLAQRLARPEPRELRQPRLRCALRRGRRDRRRRELVGAMQDIVREECPWACLYYRREFVLVGPSILGFRLHDFPLGAEKHWRSRNPGPR